MIPEDIHWFAAKVHYNRTRPIAEQLITDKVNYYIPEIISSLLFIQSTESYVKQLEQRNYDRLWFYRDLLTKKPSAIPEREMDIFIFVCSSGKEGLTYLGDDKPEYHEGDLVRVTEGPFKGAVGHIKRIKKDRRLIVSISGIATVATSYIHPQFLETVKV